jgi:thiol-disulfide isomerase/thioredoxin
MNKRVLLIGGLLVVVAGAFAYVLLNKPAIDNAKQVTVSQRTPTQKEAGPAQAAQPGAYVDYSPSVIAATPGTKLLFFHASWCPQCRALDADIKASGVPSGITIIKTDYDSNQALRQKYGVTIQTTIVRVDDNGNFIAKYVAYDDPTLAAVLKGVL